MYFRKTVNIFYDISCNALSSRYGTFTANFQYAPYKSIIIIIITIIMTARIKTFSSCDITHRTVHVRMCSVASIQAVKRFVIMLT